MGDLIDVSARRKLLDLTLCLAGVFDCCTMLLYCPDVSLRNLNIQVSTYNIAWYFDTLHVSIVSPLYRHPTFVDLSLIQVLHEHSQQFCTQRNVVGTIFFLTYVIAVYSICI